MADTKASLAQALQSSPKDRAIPSGKKSANSKGNVKENSSGKETGNIQGVRAKVAEGHFDKMIRLATGKKGAKADQILAGDEISIADLLTQGPNPVEHTDLPLIKVQSGKELTSEVNAQPSLVSKSELVGNQVINEAKTILKATKPLTPQGQGQGKVQISKEIESTVKQESPQAVATEGKVETQAKPNLNPMQVPEAKLDSEQPDQGKPAMLQLNEVSPAVVKTIDKSKPVNIKGKKAQRVANSASTEQIIPQAAANGVSHSVKNAASQSQGLPGKVDLAEVITSRSGKGPDEQKKATLLEGSPAEKGVSLVREAGSIDELSQISSISQKSPSVQVTTIESTSSVSQDAIEAMERPAARQLANFLHRQTAKPGDEMVLHLDPPELGKIKMAFKAEGNNLRMVMEIENSRTLEEIQRSAPALLQRLNDSGINVGKMDLLSDESTREDQTSSSPNGEGLEKDPDSNNSSDQSRLAVSDSLIDDSSDVETETNTTVNNDESLDRESVNVWI